MKISYCKERSFDIRHIWCVRFGAVIEYDEELYVKVVNRPDSNHYNPHEPSPIISQKSDECILYNLESGFLISVKPKTQVKVLNPILKYTDLDTAKEVNKKLI